MRRHRHARAQECLDVCGWEWRRGEGSDQAAHGADVGRQVLGCRVGEVVEKPGAEQRPERRLAELDGAADELDGADSIRPCERT